MGSIYFNESGITADGLGMSVTDSRNGCAGGSAYGLGGGTEEDAYGSSYLLINNIIDAT